MQNENVQTITLGEEELAQFDEFKRQKKLKEAQNFLLKLELDLTALTYESNSLKRLIFSANDLKLGAICLLPCAVKWCKLALSQNKKCAIIAIISHLHGGETTEIKCASVKKAIRDGADEVEVTAPVFHIKNASWGTVKREFKKLKKAAKNKAIRINLEAPLLTETEITKTCSLAADCGVNYIVTSSGYYGLSNDSEIVKTVKYAVKDKCQVKVNGVENRVQVQEICELGAAKCGTKTALDIAKLILSFAEKV